MIKYLKKFDATIVIPEDKGNPDYGTSNLYHWYKQDACSANTDYIKFDDDIVWIEPNFIDKMFNYREKYKDKHFLIFPNIVNNAIITNIQTRLGCLNWDFGSACWYNPLDAIGWGNGVFAENLHRMFLEYIKNDTYTELYFDKWILDKREQVSINSISWSGEDFVNIVPFMNHPATGAVRGNGQDEWHINNYGPGVTNKHSVILGDMLCAHYSFFVQKSHLDSTNILEQYKNLTTSV